MPFQTTLDGAHGNRLRNIRLHWILVTITKGDRKTLNLVGMKTCGNMLSFLLKKLVIHTYEHIYVCIYVCTYICQKLNLVGKTTVCDYAVQSRLYNWKRQDGWRNPQ